MPRRRGAGRLLHALAIHLLVLIVTAAQQQQQQKQCAPLSLLSPPARPAAAPLFPTDNAAREVTGRELHDLLAGAAASSSSRLVVLFHLAGDAHSEAIAPVFRCLAPFFNEVPFVLVAYSELSLMALMSQGLHALPVLQVNAHGLRYRYSGKHWLPPMLHFVSRALAQEPAASVDVARFCSSSNQLPPHPGLPPNSCQQRTLADAHAEGWCDQDTECSRLWECSRWDGEVTLQELRSQRPAPLFFLSVMFLVLRGAWLLLQFWRKRRRSLVAAAGVAGDGGVADAGAVAVPPAPPQPAAPTEAAGVEQRLAAAGGVGG